MSNMEAKIATALSVAMNNGVEAAAKVAEIHGMRPGYAEAAEILNTLPTQLPGHEEANLADAIAHAIRQHAANRDHLFGEMVTVLLDIEDEEPTNGPGHKFKIRSRVRCAEIAHAVLEKVKAAQ